MWHVACGMWHVVQMSMKDGSSNPSWIKDGKKDRVD